MSEVKRLRLLWLTNIPAPYRLSTWKALDHKTDLKLIFLNKTERGREWQLEKELEPLTFRTLGIKAFYPGSSIPLYLNFFKPIREIKNSGASAIYIDGWESPAYFFSAIFAKKMKMKVIFGYRGTTESHRFNNAFIRKIRSAIFSRADFIVTAGTASTKAVEAMGFASDKIITLFNPVDVVWFNSFAKDYRLSQSQGHRYIYVGQLIERKNVASVIQAFAEIKKLADTLTIVGDGPLASDLSKLSRSLGIEESTHFVGYKNQNELIRIYAESNTLILASTNEVWGLVVNEALASGLHVVISDKCGAAEFVKNMKGAYVCSPDKVSIKKAMIASASDWVNFIEHPEILKFTPENFVDNLLKKISD